jgi:murein DD-endopeptidase MepM/ murein hydrolase activator NlpD
VRRQDASARRARHALPALALLVALAAAPTPAAAVRSSDARALAADGWVWPATSFRLERAYVAPAHRYGSGHRGIDLRLLGASQVRSPAGGVVAFAADVAGRGVVTIAHGGGLVTTLEPVNATVSPGVAVRAGDGVGTLSVGGHSEPGTLHFGVRWEGEYINPILLLDEVPRAILLPCC